jgi:uncharacterized membrane protein YeiH
MQNQLFHLIDFLGVAAFSISGVFAAMEKRLDVFGIFIIAFVTAMGGGTLRDILIGDLPVNWMRSSNYGLIVFLVSVVTIIFNKVIRNFQRTLFVFDSLGLGLFTVAGIQKGIEFHLSSPICILLGTLTGCFGGVIRDISLNTIPLIFQREIYAMACIIGGIIYFILLKLKLDNYTVASICIVAVFLVRFFAVRFKLALPDLYKSRTP